MGFKDAYYRDDFFSRGPMLAEHRDHQGKPTCGIRLHIPAHLMSSFKTLEQYGYELKNKHGNEIKKHIKFEDYDGTLFLQVKHRNDKDWLNFSVEQARSELKGGNDRRIKMSNIHKVPSIQQSNSGGLFVVPAADNKGMEIGEDGEEKEE